MLNMLCLFHLFTVKAKIAVFSILSLALHSCCDIDAGDFHYGAVLVLVTEAHFKLVETNIFVAEYGGFLLGKAKQSETTGVL